MNYGVDAFVAAYRFDAVHGGDLTVIINSSFVFAPDLDQLRIEIVERGGEMSRGARCHAGTDGTAIDDYYRPAGAAELIRDGKAR